MITRNALRAIALATSCLAPLAAFAQAPAPPPAHQPRHSSSAARRSAVRSASAGMGVLGQNADQAGRYNGLNTTGLDLLGDFDLMRPRPLELRRDPVLSSSTATTWCSRPAIASASATASAATTRQLGPRHQQQLLQRRLGGVQSRRSGHLGVQRLLQRHHLHRQRHQLALHRQRQPGVPEPRPDAVWRRDVANRRHAGRPASSLLHGGRAGGDRRHAARPDRHAARHRRRRLQVHLGRLDLHRRLPPRAQGRLDGGSRSTAPMAARRLPCRSTTTPTATMRRPPTTPACSRAYCSTRSRISPTTTFRHPALSVREHGEARIQESAAYSTPPSNSAHYVTLHAGDQCHTEDARQPERACRRGKAGRHVPAEHRRSRCRRLVGTAGFYNLNPMLQGTSRKFARHHGHGLPGQGQRIDASDPQHRYQRVSTASMDAASA